MILQQNIPNMFFKIKNLHMSTRCKNTLIELSKDYNHWPAFGNKNKELYILSPSVIDIPELQDILDCINVTIVNDIKFNLMAIAPGCTIAAHTDPDRFSAINIPIVGNFRTSYLQFFEQGSSEKIVTNFVKNDGTRPNPPGVNYPNPKLIGRVYYQDSICINTTQIHNVRNLAREPRVLLSLGFEITKFERLEQLYRENILLTRVADKYVHERNIQS